MAGEAFYGFRSDGRRERCYRCRHPGLQPRRSCRRGRPSGRPHSFGLGVRFINCLAVRFSFGFANCLAVCLSHRESECLCFCITICVGKCIGFCFGLRVGNALECSGGSRSTLT